MERRQRAEGHEPYDRAHLECREQVLVAAPSRTPK